MRFSRQFIIAAIFALYLTVQLSAQPALVDSLKQELELYSQQDTSRVTLLLDLSRRLYRADPSEARSYAEEALQISRSLELIKEEAHAARYIGYTLNMQGKADSALLYMDIALELYESISDFRGIAIVNGAVGTIYAINDQFELAITKMLEALEAYKLLENNSAVAVMYNNIGNIYLEQEIFDRAIDYYIQSISTYKNAGNQRGIILPYSGIASVFVQIKDFEQAKIYNDLGIEKGIEFNDQSALGFMYEISGDIEKHYSNYDVAREDYQQSVEIFTRLQNPTKRTDVLFSIAKLDFEISDYEATYSNLEIILSMLENGIINNVPLQESSLELMALTEQRLGLYSSGLQHALEAKTLSDSLNQEEVAVKIAELETNFEAEKKDNEILVLSYENQAARLRITIISILGIGFVLVLSIIYLESLKRKSLQKNLEMKALQKELEQYGILLNEKNTYMSKVLEKLDELNSDIKSTSGRKNLYNLIDSLKQNISTSESEEVMFKKIEQVNAGFFRALKVQSGNLSSSEKRLASLVQMDLSSKDIANILHINSKSVNQAKYRLKKKLGIHPDTDLKEYLNSLVTE